MVAYLATDPPQNHVADAGQMVELHGTIETCGRVNLYSWHQILSVPPAEVGNPIFVWSAWFGIKPGERM